MYTTSQRTLIYSLWCREEADLVLPTETTVISFMRADARISISPSSAWLQEGDIDIRAWVVTLA